MPTGNFCCIEVEKNSLKVGGNAVAGKLFIRNRILMIELRAKAKSLHTAA